MQNDTRLPKRALTALLFLCCIGINIYFRLFPAYFPQLKEKAKDIARSEILKEAEKSLNSLSEGISSSAKEEIVLAALKEKENSKSYFNQKVLEEYKKLKDKYQDKNGQTYLLEVDPYQWFRYTENILKNGHPGDVIRNGNNYDMYTLVPVGARIVPNTLFFYLSAYLYKIYSFFIKESSLWQFTFYLPIFYLLIFLFSLYLFSKYIFSKTSAIIAMFLVGLNGFFLRRSCVGWFDYEFLAISFPLAIAGLLIAAVKNKENIKKMIICSLCASFFFGLYSFTWLGYRWIFLVAEFALLWSLLNAYSIVGKFNEEVKGYLIVASVFFFGSILFCYAITKVNFIGNLSGNIKSMLNLGTSNSLNIFPNTFYTVAELKKTNWAVISSACGGVFIFISFCAVLFFYLKERCSENKFAVTMMVFWSFAMLFAALKSIRFIVFLSIPLGIFLAAAIEEIFKSIKKYCLNKKAKLIATFIFFIFILAGGITLLASANRGVSSLYPLINSDWYKTLIYIRENTPKGAVINSWWDYGNYFKAVSRRRVIFDPQTQQRPLAHWMAKVLLNNDEKDALSILRMLNNSSDSLYEEMNTYIKDDFRCVAILNRLLQSKPQEAEAILAEYKFPSDLRRKIMDAIFFTKPCEAYFLVDRKMASMMSSISFLGNWNFPKVYALRNKNLPKETMIANLREIFLLPQKQAEAIYEQALSAAGMGDDEIKSSRYQFVFGIEEGKKDDNLIYFNNGIIFNQASLKAMVFLPLSGEYKLFKYVYFFDGKKMAYQERTDSNFDWGCLVVNDNNNFISVGLSKELAQSLFVKLYFLKGKGLKYFEPFYSDDKAGIYVFRIKWEELDDASGKYNNTKL